MRCIDVAALVAAAMLRKNPGAMVLPFESDVVKCDLNSRDTVMTNAQKLAAIGGGGTNCSAPLALLNKNKVQASLVVLVSDNESWLDANRHGATQALEREDVLNIGGFSDEVWVGEIESVAVWEK